jgi:hypothetical protein
VIPETATLTPSQEGAGLLSVLRSRRRRTAAGQARDQVAQQSGAAASHLLVDRCAAIQEGLSQAGVHAWRLDTLALQHLYYRRLCPRTAHLQPFDQGHTAPVATAPVLFDQTSATPYDETTET